ncbi:M23 family metallopeptidase [Arthrobacter rhombi]|uniref:M23 family metallopeptidase n=1 Tax=Arthrobacter rhombi TaxID=71253 RepID=UPI003FD68712
MNDDEFQKGDSVQDDADRTGVVAPMSWSERRNHPGLVYVRWDAGARTWILPELLTPIDSRSASSQAGRGQAAGTSTPQDVPAQTIESIRRVEGLLGDIKDLLTAQAGGGKTYRIVQKGDVLGYAGSTGNSSGEHLHFETGRRK